MLRSSSQSRRDHIEFTELAQQSPPSQRQPHPLYDPHQQQQTAPASEGIYTYTTPPVITVTAMKDDQPQNVDRDGSLIDESETEDSGLLENDIDGDDIDGEEVDVNRWSLGKFWCRKKKATSKWFSSIVLFEWIKLLFLGVLLTVNVRLFIQCTNLTSMVSSITSTGAPSSAIASVSTDPLLVTITPPPTHSSLSFIAAPHLYEADPTSLSSSLTSPHLSPRQRRLAVISMLTNDYCRGAAVLFKSFLRLCPFKLKEKSKSHHSTVVNAATSPNANETHSHHHTFINLTDIANESSPYSCGVHFVLIHPPSFNASSMPLVCSFISTYNVTLYAIRSQPLPPNSRVGRANWAAAVDKLAVTGLDMFDRILFVDADSIFVRSLMDYFHPVHDLYQVAGVVDQTGGCQYREQLNSGTLLLTPSKYLHGAMQQLLLHGEPCLSDNWHWGDQEVYNCLCGTSGSKKPYHRDITCRLLPSYWGQMGDARECDEYDVKDVHLIHFAGPSKPWLKNGWDTGSHPQHQFWHCTEDSSWEMIMNMTDPGCQLRW